VEVSLIKRSKNPTNIEMQDRKLTFGDKLVLIRKYFGISITDMSDLTGIVKSNISRYERDLVAPGVHFLSVLKKHYPINMNWFFDDKEDMITGRMRKRRGPNKKRFAKKAANLEPVTYTSFGIPIFGEILENEEYLLPVSGSISAGEPLEIKEMESTEFVPFPISKSDDLEQYLVFKVNGLSMAPEIAHQDIIFVKRNNNWLDLNNRIVAVMIRGEMTLKKMIIDNQNHDVMFKALNRDYDDIVISFEMMDGIFLVGELKAIRRIYKK